MRLTALVSGDVSEAGFNLCLTTVLSECVHHVAETIVRIFSVITAAGVFYRTLNVQIHRNFFCTFRYSFAEEVWFNDAALH